jgi:hypothetical protein
MNVRFAALVERLVREKGQAALMDAAKREAYLADYAKNEFTKERHLLTIAIESGAGKEIVNAPNLAICKQQQIRFLKEERFIDETSASEVIDLLAFVLRGDQSTSFVQTPQYNQPSQQPYSQPYPQQYAPPQSLPVEYIGFCLSGQATPGKMAVSAKIVDAKTLGKPSTRQFINRYVAYCFSFIPLGLGFLWIAFDRQKRGWHDMLAGTLVIKS